MAKKVWTTVFLLIFTVLVFTAGGCGTDGQIGTVDMQKVMTDSGQAKALQKQFEAKRSSLQSAADKDAAQKELMLFGQTLEKTIQAELDKVLTDVSKSHGFTAIAYKGAIAQGGVDVTDEIIGKLK